ncbi:MAG: LruC domain-containing protein [Bacteroidota bacterium]
MKRILTLIILSALVSLSSCQKQDATEGTVAKDIDDLKVPAGFTWESSRDIYFEISITDTKFSSAIHVVSIYDADPARNGKLLAKGSGSISSPFMTKVYLPNTIKEVFVVKTASDNSETMQKVAVTGIKLDVKLSGVIKDGVLSTNQGKISGLSDSPDCATGCTQTITSSNTNLNVNNGDVICVTGNNITIGFNGNGGTVRICGSNVTVQNANLNNSAKLIITRTASVTFSNLNMNGTSSEFINYGTTSVNGSFSPKGTITNEGKLTTGGDFNLNTDTDFLNNGVLNVGATMNVNTNTVAINNGSITTTQHFELNSNSDFINNCFIWAKGEYKHNADMFNHGLIKVNSTTTVNGNSLLSLHNGAMLSTKDIKLNGEIIGVGTRSVVKVTGESTLNGGGSVKNSVQFCDANGVETNKSPFSGGASLGCNQYIPVTNCNTEGNGQAPIADSDGDGVNDPQDEYPADPTKAFNNYYPSSSPTSGATVAFEDQWPRKGDYDMNDVVVSYRYKIVTSAQNKVVQVNGDYTLHASGGNLKNAFAVEFPLNRSSASSVTGGTLETNQDKAVIILFSNMRAEMVNWNTVPGEATTAEKNYSISFNVTNGPSLSVFGLGSYNPFIWDNGSLIGRGYEIHLPGQTPTNRANSSIFGTDDDNTNPGAARYYLTAGNLPWAISMPVKPFKYPKEQTPIVGGYLKFQTWAESGGSQFVDWYSNTSTGYQDLTKLY